MKLCNANLFAWSTYVGTKCLLMLSADLLMLIVFLYRMLSSGWDLMIISNPCELEILVQLTSPSSIWTSTIRTAESLFPALSDKLFYEHVMTMLATSALNWLWIPYAKHFSGQIYTLTQPILSRLATIVKLLTQPDPKQKCLFLPLHPKPSVLVTVFIWILSICPNHPLVM